MFRSNALAAIATIALVIAIIAASGRTATAAGPTKVDLGSAVSYAVFAAAAITNTGSTVINGDLGLDPNGAASVTGFGGAPAGVVNGITHTADAASLAARNLLKAAYVDAANRPAATPLAGADNQLGAAGNLTAGLYSFGAATTANLTGVLTLTGSASDVWIFQASSTLVTAAGSSIVLAGGAQSCNVFWQVGSSATLGSASTFRGTILAHTSIAAGTAGTPVVDGRLLAGVGPSADVPSSDTGALTFPGANTVTVPACAAVAPAPAPAAPAPTPIVCPAGFTGTFPACVPIESSSPLPSPTVAPAPGGGSYNGGTPTPSQAPTQTPALTTPTPTLAPTQTPATSAPTPAPSLADLPRLPSTGTSGGLPIAAFGLALLGFGATVWLRRSRRARSSR